MIFWLTGNSGSGKTTLARNLAGKNTVILDGDQMREVWPGLAFTQKDRWEQGLRTARLAAYLESQGVAVIVAVIAPYEELRRRIEGICDCKWIYLPGGKKDDDFPYEVPDKVSIVVSQE